MKKKNKQKKQDLHCKLNFLVYDTALHFQSM